jgi:hypothetical protein
MDEIQPYTPNDPELWDADRQERRLAPNGKPVRCKRLDAVRILTPMFAMFPKIEMSKLAIGQYARLLADIPPHRLQQAVDSALQVTEFLPTVAAIRQAYETQMRNERQLSPPGYSQEEREDWQERYVGIEWIVRDPNETRQSRLAQLRRYRRQDDDR